MTTTSLPRPDGAEPSVARTDQPALAVQFGRNLTAEWTKLRSVRSSIISLLATGAVCIGFAVLLSYGMLSRWDQLSPQRRASFHPATFSVSGVFFGQLVIGALGVLAMSAEYSTGTIRATVSATPQRLAMYLSKIVVFALTALVVALISMTVAFLGAQAILSSKQIGAGISDPGVPRILLGSALFLVAVGLLGLGLATLLRHTAGAISTVFGLMLVLPLLSNFMPSDWQANVDKWLPLNAGATVMQTTAEAGQFGPWTGLGVLYGYALVALVAGGVVLARRDA